MKTLPPEFHSEPSLKLFNDTTNLAKSYLNAQKALGRDKIVVPDLKNATEEEMLGIFKKLGLPETLDKYEVKVAEGKQIDQEIFTGFKETAHKLGILPGQAQKLLDWFGETSGQKLQSTQTAQKAAQDQALADLQREWGDGWDKKVAAARTAVDEFGGQELRDHLAKAGLSNDATLIRVLSKIGESLREDKIPQGGESRTMGLTPSEAKAEIDSVMGNRSHPYFLRDHPGHKDALERMNKLFQAQLGGRS